MILHFPAYLAILADAAVWAGWSVVVGLIGARWSDERVGRDGPLTKLRRAEIDGDLYRRLGIRRWKPWLPDAGKFGGGRRKILEHRLDRRSWTTLAGETRRAERVHWLIIAGLPVTALWSRGLLLAAMVVYALVANGPCIAAQRYNRSRLTALQYRAGRRAH